MRRFFVSLNWKPCASPHHFPFQFLASSPNFLKNFIFHGYLLRFNELLKCFAQLISPTNGWSFLSRLYSRPALNAAYWEDRIRALTSFNKTAYSFDVWMLFINDSSDSLCKQVTYDSIIKILFAVTSVWMAPLLSTATFHNRVLWPDRRHEPADTKLTLPSACGTHLARRRQTSRCIPCAVACCKLATIVVQFVLPPPISCFYFQQRPKD